MKTSALLRLAFGLLFLLASPLAQAQTTPAPAPAQPGYWNVEINRATRDYTLVRFYDGQDRLVYEERLDGLCLDLSRATRRCRCTKRQLDAALQAALRDPATPGQPADRLARLFGADRRVLRAYAAR